MFAQISNSHLYIFLYLLGMLNILDKQTFWDNQSLEYNNTQTRKDFEKLVHTN